MGPQLYRCGNLNEQRNSKVRYLRFNGAATLSLRKFCSLLYTQSSHIPLQWGRNFIVAEMRNLLSLARGVTLASMGPQLYRCGNPLPLIEVAKKWDMLQWGRNFIVAEIRPFRRTRQRARRSFNGAATLSLRKSGSATGEHRGSGTASMGPQLYRCGNGTLGPIIGSDCD